MTVFGTKKNSEIMSPAHFSKRSKNSLDPSYNPNNTSCFKVDKNCIGCSGNSGVVLN